MIRRLVYLFAAFPLTAIAAEKAPTAPADLGERVLIPAGAFEMGRANTSSNFTGARLANEGPVRTVTLRAFEILRHEVTVEMWVDFLHKAGGRAAWHARQPIDRVGRQFRSAVDPAEPIRAVTWYQARAFCRWIGMDLPSEPQWERAAQGPGAEPREYPWGDARPDCSRANLADPHARCHDGPRPVGAHGPGGESVEHIADLAGNVAEWIRDRYAYAYDPEETVDPGGPKVGPHRVVRGGSYLAPWTRGRVAARVGAPPDTRSPSFGFRCARVIDEDDPEPVSAPASPAPEGEPIAAWARPGPRAAPPEVLATGLIGARQLVRAGERWLVPVAGAVWAVPTSGGEPEVWRDPVPETARVVADGDRVYAWTAERLWRLDADSFSEEAPVRAVAVADGALWWTDDVDGGRLRVRADEGAIETVATGVGLVTALAIGPEHVYLGRGGDTPRGVDVWHRGERSLAPGEPTPFVAQFLAATDDGAFGVLRGGNRLTAAGWLYRIEPDGALAPIVVVRHGAGDPQVIGDRVYWHGPWAVFSVAADDRDPDVAPRALALDTAPVGLVVDARYATWIDGWKGALYRRVLDDD